MWFHFRSNSKYQWWMHWYRVSTPPVHHSNSSPPIMKFYYFWTLPSCFNPRKLYSRLPHILSIRCKAWYWPYLKLTSGLLSFASTTLVLSLINVSTRGVTTPNIVVGMALGVGGLAQLLAGMWEFAAGNTLGATGKFRSGRITFLNIQLPGRECHVTALSINHIIMSI